MTTKQSIRIRIETAPAHEGPNGSWTCVFATADEKEAKDYVWEWFQSHRKGERLRIIHVH
jgi:hypothetical protein